MEKRVGMWLDRNKAVIVSIANNVEGRRIITSDMEHYVLYSKIIPGDGSPEEVRDRRFWNHLGEYYDKIIEHIRDAVEIQIFGPEMAKYELQKHLENQGLAGHIVSGGSQQIVGPSDFHKGSAAISTPLAVRSLLTDWTLVPQVTENNTLRLMDAAGEYLLYDEYRDHADPMIS